MSPCSCCGDGGGEEIDTSNAELLATVLAQKMLSGEITSEAAGGIAGWCRLPWRTVALALTREHVRFRKAAS